MENILFIKKIFLFFYIAFLTSTLSNAGVSISVSLLCLCLIYIYYKSRDLVYPDQYFIIIYGVFFASLFIAAFILGDMKSIKATSKYLYWSLPFWVVYIAGCKSFSSKVWGYAICLSMLTLSLYSAYQFLINPLGTRITSFFASGNGLAGVLEIVIPFLIAFVVISYKDGYKKYIRYFIMAVTVLTIFALVASQSRGGIAGWVLGGIFVFVIRFKYSQVLNRQFIISKNILCTGILLFALCSVSFLGLSTFQRGYDNERFLMIQSSYEMWNDHKVCGVGFANWKEYYREGYVSPTAKEPHVPMPHNNIAFFFSTTGIIGGIGYGIFVLGMIILLIQKIRSNPHNWCYQAALWSFVAISVHGLVDSGITNKYNMQILCMCLGIAFSSDKALGDARNVEKQYL